ncbi:hypothetical protein LSAT2_009654 [Lamellibrachia satsuma]|nr:hypothetical protein LSAT2_009654 [Lamellibrachia satsuma]
MTLTLSEAHEILEMPIGADPDSIRTSYKRLSLKWYPESHGNSPDVTKKFKEVTRAYKRIMLGADTPDMSLDDVYNIFDQVMSNKFSYSNGINSSDDDDSDDDDDDDDEPCQFTEIRLKTESDLSSRRNLTLEEIERNANELISEEEKEKRRAVKRRAKKKRRREKKRQEKLQAEQQKKDEEDQKKHLSQTKNGIGEKDRTRGKKQERTADSSDLEAEEFDTTAAFFTAAINKKKKKTPGGQTEPHPPSRQRAADSHGADDNVEELDPVVLRSRQLAIRGNEMANSGHYNPAVDLFTEAIKLDPMDFRFFGNRSYCYDRMQRFERALKDAECAVTLAPEWPKGYFRKGRALAGLKLYAEAEQAFVQVLKLDQKCEDAVQELLRVRTHQITEMGFSRQQAEQAIRQHGSVQQALDLLLAGVVGDTSLSSDVYISDEEDYATQVSLAVSIPLVAGSPVHQRVAPLPTSLHNLPPHIPPRVNDVKMDSANPEGLTALWVGNVLPEVNDKKLVQMFSKFGEVTSVRALPDKFCAFINFKKKECAGKAMAALQGMECAGQKLYIRFPDNPVTSNGTVVTRKTSTTGSKSSNSGTVTKPQAQVTKPQAQVIKPQAQVTKSQTQVTKPQATMTQQQLGAKQQVTSTMKPSGTARSSKPPVKVTGPVNGNECYFWRTTGCSFGKNCHNKHVPGHKGIDIKPWHMK